MLYELINPSDPYTFIAKDREVAALAVFLLSTCYGAHCLTEEREDDDVPVFILGGSREWYEETFKRTPDDGLNHLKNDVILCLDSFVYGHEADRKVFQMACESIPDPEKRKEFSEQWHNARTSLNDIGKHAWDLADKLRISVN